MMMVTGAHANVCNRSPVVAKWLEKSLGYSCAVIGDKDLAKITDLNWSHFTNQLAPGDLDGFVNLQTLDLSSNYGLVLPPKIFKDLANLKILKLDSNNFETLPPDVFAGLWFLDLLDLSHNNFQTIEPWYFHHLGHLRRLSLENNPILTLPPGAFEELTQLESLYFFNSQLDHLSREMLGGLLLLKELRLETFKRDFVIDADTFDLVPNLRSLSLTGYFAGPLSAALKRIVHLEKLDVALSDLSHIDRQFLAGLTELRDRKSVV